jgi:hypothetical protein
MVQRQYLPNERSSGRPQPGHPGMDRLKETGTRAKDEAVWVESKTR